MGRANSDEAYVLDLCDEVLDEPGSRQHRFDWLRGDPNRQGRRVRLPVDGYWPNHARREALIPAHGLLLVVIRPAGLASDTRGRLRRVRDADRVVIRDRFPHLHDHHGWSWQCRPTTPRDAPRNPAIWGDATGRTAPRHDP